MNRLTSIAIAVSFVCAVPLTALSQNTVSTSPTTSGATTATTRKDLPIRIKLVDTKITAKVVELDMANRRATFLTPTNDFVTVRVPRKIHYFDQVKVGDSLVVHYTVAAAAKINPAVKDGIRETIETSTAAAARPGAAMRNRVEVLANIQSFDIKARTVTIQGATRTVTITVPDNLDMSRLQVGDQVQAEFSEAVAIDIEPVPAGNK